jgi:hypothetical protein
MAGGTMKASFNGARKNLVTDFNLLVCTKTRLDDEQKQILNDLRNTIVGLLCMYDENDPESSCLIDTIILEEVYEDGI